MRHPIFSLLLIALLVAPLAGAQSRQQPASDDQSDRPKIDVESYSLDVTLAPQDHRLEGKADIKFKQLDRKNYATFDLDRRLRIDRASIGNAEVRYRQFDVDSTVEFDLSNQQFNGNPVLHVEYSGAIDPEENRHEPVLARVNDDSAFLLYEGKWFPTNALYRDKADMRMKIHAPADWTLVADVPKSGDGFASLQPSYWGTIAAGKYTATNYKSDSGDVVVNSLKTPPDVVKSVAETSGKVIDYYSRRFGSAPALDLHIVEVDGANWPSQWSVGMLLLPSSQLKKDFDVPTLAATLAHQWFPLKVAVKDPGADAWLVDGMAQFASLLYSEQTLSPAELQERVNKALVKALSYEGTTSIRQAGNLEKDSPEYRSLVEYKGAYVLRMLRWVVGDETFDKILSEYVKQFQNTPASTEAFQKLASDVAGGDLGYFFDQWLNGSGVPEFKLEYTVFRMKDGYKVLGQVKQDLDLFRMPVEFQIQTDGDPEYARVDVVGPSSEFEAKTERKPKGVVIDPKERILRMSPDIRINVLVNRGEEFANDGKYNDAIDQYQKAVDIDAHNSLALFRMGEALFELGNLQAASGMFQEALNGDLKPKWVEVWAYINRGKIFDLRGQRERAVTEYQKASNTGDDSYGAQGEADKYVKEPFRRAGKTTIG